MKTPIKFRDVAEVLTYGACYVCVDIGDNRKECREDYIASPQMLAAAVSAMGDYDVTGLEATDGEREPRVIIQPAGGSDQK